MRTAERERDRETERVGRGVGDRVRLSLREGVSAREGPQGTGGGTSGGGGQHGGGLSSDHNTREELHVNVTAPAESEGAMNRDKLIQR